MASKKTVAERLWSKVEKTDTCWYWKGHLNNRGYGMMQMGTHSNPKPELVHRIAYQLVIGAIPEGLTLDHLCNNPACVNPEHLKAVTMRENVLRGNNPTGINSRKTTCIRGHALIPDNRPSRIGMNARYCPMCQSVRHQTRKGKHGSQETGAINGI